MGPIVQSWFLAGGSAAHFNRVSKSESSLHSAERTHKVLVNAVTGQVNVLAEDSQVEPY